MSAESKALLAQESDAEPLAERSEVDGEEVVPATWESVKALPALQTPDHGTLICERLVGTSVVGIIIAFCVGCVMLTTTDVPEASAPKASMCRRIIYLEAAIALYCLFTLQYGSRGVLQRSPQACFPLPPAVADRLRAALRRSSTGDVEEPRPPSLSAAMEMAVEGLHNVTDPDPDGRGVYCVRCLLWRPADGHHCSTCQRCVPEFDHHCGVLGCCVHGSATRGNMCQFCTLLALAAVGFLSAMGVGVAMAGDHPYRPARYSRRTRPPHGLSSHLSSSPRRYSSSSSSSRARRASAAHRPSLAQLAANATVHRALKGPPPPKPPPKPRPVAHASAAGKLV